MTADEEASSSGRDVLEKLKKGMESANMSRAGSFSVSGVPPTFQNLPSRFLNLGDAISTKRKSPGSDNLLLHH